MFEKIHNKMIKNGTKSQRDETKSQRDETKSQRDETKSQRDENENELKDGIKNDVLNRSVDSREYEILIDACTKIDNVPGFTCEIGTYRGGSSYKIMLTRLLAHKKNNCELYPHISIDPYGNIEYTHWETRTERGGRNYTNKIRNSTLKSLYNWCDATEFPFLFFNMEDTEFFKRFSDGVPVYNENKYLINSYALVFFDGPHSTKHIKTEIDFFKDRTPINGCWVFDDIDQYPHMLNIDPIVHNLGFQTLQKGICKISYIRIANKSNQPPLNQPSDSSLNQPSDSSLNQSLKQSHQPPHQPPHQSLYKNYVPSFDNVFIAPPHDNNSVIMSWSFD